MSSTVPDPQSVLHKCWPKRIDEISGLPTQPCSLPTSSSRASGISLNVFVCMGATFCHFLCLAMAGQFFTSTNHFSYSQHAVKHSSLYQALYQMA